MLMIKKSNMYEIRACIFDLDGVIVDTAKYHFLAWKRLADQLGLDLQKKIMNDLKVSAEWIRLK